MRWTVIGAGAIGGVVGAQLHRIGEDVTLVARGDHLAAIERDGLTLVDPGGRHVLRTLVADSIATAAGRRGGSGRLGDTDTDTDGPDVVVLAVKAQHTAGVLDELARFAGPATRILCLQNGVDNERQAARFFPEVYGVCVTLLASYQQPGVVSAHSAPVVGTLQLGRFPAGADDTAAQIAEVLGRASITSTVEHDVVSFKRAKLLANLANALEVICPPEGDRGPVVALLAAEARAAFAAAALPLPGPEVSLAVPEAVDPAVPRVGGSTAQSILRGAGSVETDYLNGEIVLLGRLHDVPTPANALVQSLARAVADGAIGAGSVPPRALLDRLT
jgi:2-dehydropantoate 2-reductase